MKSFGKYLKNPLLIYSYLSTLGVTKFVPDRVHLKIMYRAHLGRKLDLTNPKAFNEKIQWLKLYDRKPIYSVMADKLRAKQWAGSIIGDRYIVPAIGHWEDVDQIDIDLLPDSFVLKTNHDCGGVLVCKDKSEFNLIEAKRFLSMHMKSNYYWFGREWQYSRITPCVFAEKYLDDGGEDLFDYKVLCFEGVPRFIQLHRGRTSFHTEDMYDADWNLVDIEWVDYPQTGSPIPRPCALDEMLMLSEKLAKGLHHLRVDWFIVDGKLYLGELTLHNGSGFTKFSNYSDDIYLGSFIEL